MCHLLGEDSPSDSSPTRDNVVELTTAESMVLISCDDLGKLRAKAMETDVLMAGGTVASFS